MYYYDDKLEGEEDGGEMMDDEEFDSDDALFFDNNDLANRIWEDNDWFYSSLLNEWWKQNWNKLVDLYSNQLNTLFMY